MKVYCVVDGKIGKKMMFTEKKNNMNLNAAITRQIKNIVVEKK